MNNIIYVGKHLLTLSVNRHAHSSWELVYCTEGSGSFRFDDFELPYKKGDIVVVPPLMPHENVSRDGFTNIHINMTDTALPFKSPSVVQDDSHQFLLRPSRRFTTISTATPTGGGCCSLLTVT